MAALGLAALRAANKASRDKRLRDWGAERNAVHVAAITSAAVVKRWNVMRCLQLAHQWKTEDSAAVHHEGKCGAFVGGADVV